MKTMEIYKYMLWIIYIMFLSNGHITAEDSCGININNCDYEVTVSPKGQCNRDDVKGYRVPRSTRSTCDSNVSMVTSKVEKLENKLGKEMQQLSARVLRGVRRVEAAISDLVAKQTKRGMRNPHVCPPGFVSVDNWRSCYMFSRFNATWFEARDYCTALDSDLVSLTTLKEHYLVTFLIKNNDEIRNAEAWWTSGQFVSKTKTWMWTSDTELRPFSFIKWAVGEPNDSSLQCVMLFSGDNHFWHDQLCTEKFNFVCEFQTAIE